MEVSVPYEAALAAFPNEVGRAMTDFKNSKSKLKSYEAEELDWYYAWGEKAEAMTAAGMASELAEKAKKTAEERKAEWEDAKKVTVQERIDDIVSRMTPVQVYGSLGGRALATAELPAGVVPTEVASALHVRCQEAYDEDQRLLGLTEEERKAEADALLEELAKDRGFKKVEIPEPELPEGICCQFRDIASRGYDTFQQGHHEPVNLELHDGVWNLVQEGWFSTPIKHCPWCGVELPLPEFELGKDAGEETVDESGVDALLDAIENAIKEQT